ncbi:MAG: hypothetical protein EBZ91_10890 [Gammaproteobacteria bacterium]|nr:hypothetical protein [Gammaproteobacteria bacterium]
MLQRALQLGLRMLGREWRSGELGVLLLALTVAVGALTGVGFLVNRISQSVALQANEVLAADLRLEASSAPDERYAREAERRALRTARTTSVLSVVFSGDRNQLANLRAVSDAYPLRGSIGVSQTVFGVAQLRATGPKSGEVWPDSKLLAALGVAVGDTVSVGARSFRVSQVLISRPDQGGGFGELAPSLLMNLADLPSTQLRHRPLWSLPKPCESGGGVALRHRGGDVGPALRQAASRFGRFAEDARGLEQLHTDRESRTVVADRAGSRAAWLGVRLSGADLARAGAAGFAARRFAAT